MFGVGLAEIAVIALIAVLVFGPDRLPDLVKQAGSFARQAKKMATSARDELRDELGPEYANLELRDLDPRSIVRKHIVEAMNAGDEDDDEDDEIPESQRELAVGELPPYDSEAT